MLKPANKKAISLSAKTARAAVSLTAALALSLYGFAPSALSTAWADEADKAVVSETQIQQTAADTQAEAQQAEITAEHVEDEVIVTYENGKTKLVNLDDDTSVEEAISEYSEKKNVAAVQPNFVYHVLDTEDDASDVAGSTDGTEASGTSGDADTAGDTSGNTGNAGNADDSNADKAGNTGDTEASGSSDGDAEPSSDASGASDNQDTSTLPNDARLNEQYYLFGSTDQPNDSSLRGANFASAWSKVSSDNTSTVAVIDTGCDITNPELNSNVLTDLAYDAVSQKLVKDETDGSSTSSDYDPTGHGTKVVGEIAATANNQIGIAGAGNNQLQVLPIRVAAVDEDGKVTITTSSFVNALDWLYDQVKSGKVSNLHVVNASLGYYAGPTSDAVDQKVRDAINNLLDEGVVTVVAGGNGYEDSSAGKGTYDRIYPSDFDECVSVSALTTVGTNAVFSDYNAHKDISAPGLSILSTTRGSKTTTIDGATVADGNYGKDDGTSFAAPLVSSALALLWAEQPNLTTKQAVYAVTSTASKSSLGTSLPDKSASAGALDASAALDAVKEGITVPESTLDLSASNVSVEVLMPEILTSKEGARLSDDGSSFVYYGGAYEPDVLVKVDGKTINASEYSVTYSNNVKPGTATVKLQANGTSATASFKIVADEDTDDSGKSDKTDKDSNKDSKTNEASDNSFSEDKLMKALDEGGSDSLADESEATDSDESASSTPSTGDDLPWTSFALVAAISMLLASLAAVWRKLPRRK